MQIDLKGKVAAVTGGSRGIGLATATALAAAGANVFVASRTAPPATAGVTHIPADLTDPDGPGSFLEQVMAETGRLDVLVNNVGGGDLRPNGFLGIDDAAWLAALELNLMTVVRSCRAALAPMVAQGGGCIINISTVSAREPVPMVTDYCASKAAVSCLSKSLSIEFAPAGIRINTLSPGTTDTPAMTGPGGSAEQLAAATGTDADAMVREMSENDRMPLGRMGEPTEIAAVAVFLASPQASLVSGADWIVDGGFLRQL